MGQDIIGDGFERWDWVLSISNPAAPTAAELNGGLRLSAVMTKDGATGFTADTADADTSSKESKFKTAVNGMRSLNNPRVRLKRQKPLASDAYFAAMQTDAFGWLVRRNSKDATLNHAATDLVDLFYVQLSQKAKLDQDDNMAERYDVPVKLQQDPKFDVAVV
jgi:hypothetical protein